MTQAERFPWVEPEEGVVLSGPGFTQTRSGFHMTACTPEAEKAKEAFLGAGPPLSTTKETNPKDLIGSDKLPLHLWPASATAIGCLGLLDGVGKYGRMNWREHGASASVYVAACKRHLDAWFEGEDSAQDSGVPHLAHALACLAIIVDSQATGKLIDDRAYKGEGYLKLVEELTPIVKALRAKHAGKEVHHYTIKDNK